MFQLLKGKLKKDKMIYNEIIDINKQIEAELKKIELIINK